MMVPLARRGIVRSATVLSAGVLSTIFLAGCSSGRMDLPEDLGAVPAMEVEGRGGFRQPDRIAFGEFEAAGIDRSWTRGSGWSVGLGGLGGGRNRASQTYDFTYRAEGTDVGRVECEAHAGRGTIGIGSVGVDASARAALECRMRVGEAIGDWSLDLAATRDRHLEGQLVAGERSFRLVSTGRGGGWMPAERFGFEVRREDAVVAAVETVNRGRVWLAPELSPEDRRVVAAAGLALLLYQDLATD